MTIEQAVVEYAIEYPAYEQHWTSNELRKSGVRGIRSIWLRHNLENVKKWLKVLEENVARDVIAFNDAQITALEKKTDDDETCGEIETSLTGYVGSQDTF